MNDGVTATQMREGLAELFNEFEDVRKRADRMATGLRRASRGAGSEIVKAAMADEERANARLLGSLARAWHLLTQIDRDLAKLEGEGRRGKGYAMPAHPEIASLPFMAKSAVGVRRPGAVPFHRAAATEAVATYGAAIAKALSTTAASVAAQIRRADLSKSKTVLDIHKVDLSIITDLLPTAIFLSGAAIAAIASRVARALDLSGLLGLASDPTPGEFAAATVTEALDLLGLDIGPNPQSGRFPLWPTVVDQIQSAAVKTATARAAELVGLGTERSIVDTTRNMVREAIVDGLQNRLDAGAIADSIGALDAFSPERAQLIATNELAGVNASAALEAYQGASLAAGVEIKKRWVTDPASNVCDICHQNAQQGAIPLDQPFGSGDHAPPQHLRCVCSIEPVISPAKAFHPQKKG